MLAMQEYEFPLNPEFFIESSEAFQVSMIQAQDGAGKLWALVDSESPRIVHRFVLLPNGAAVDRTVLGRFYGTILNKGEALHMFAKVA